MAKDTDIARFQIPVENVLRVDKSHSITEHASPAQQVNSTQRPCGKAVVVYPMSQITLGAPLHHKENGKRVHKHCFISYNMRMGEPTQKLNFGTDFRRVYLLAATSLTVAYGIRFKTKTFPAV